MLNNRTTPPRADDLEHESAIWEQLRAEIEAGRRSSDVYPSAALLGSASGSAYLEYDDEELSAAMQAEEQDAPGRSPREHEFSDLEERISEDSVPLDDAALLLDVHDEVQVIPPVGRRSQPPMPEGVAIHDVDGADDAETGQRISYFEKAQAEAYQQTPIAAFAQEHAASLARAQGQSRYEQAWADWDRQFDLPIPVISAAVEPQHAKRSRLLVPGLGLAALLGLGVAGYQLGVVPGSQEEETQAAAPAQPAAQPTVEPQTARADEAQRAADEATARADEAAKAAPEDTTKVATGEDKGGEPEEAKAKVGQVTEESSEARRERIREEKRAARREARHRRREERRLAAKEGRSESASSRTDEDRVDARASDEDDAETVIEPPARTKKKRAKSDEGSEDPLEGLE